MPVEKNGDDKEWRRTSKGCTNKNAAKYEEVNQYIKYLILFSYYVIANKQSFDLEQFQDTFCNLFMLGNRFYTIFII